MKASSASLVSCRQTTSGWRSSSHGSSRGTRCLTELTFQVAIRTDPHGTDAPTLLLVAGGADGRRVRGGADGGGLLRRLNELADDRALVVGAPGDRELGRAEVDDRARDHSRARVELRVAGRQERDSLLGPYGLERLVGALGLSADAGRASV